MGRKRSNKVSPSEVSSAMRCIREEYPRKTVLLPSEPFASEGVVLELERRGCVEKDAGILPGA
jgi:hypothetical protein